MIYRENNVFKLMPYKVTYTQNSETQENFTDNKKLWQAYQEMGHISDLNFETVDYSQEQIDRLVEVKDFPESEFANVEQYVVEGIVAEDSPLFYKKENDHLKAQVADVWEMILFGGGI